MKTEHTHFKIGFYTPLKSQEDINNLRQGMSKLNYPAGINDCEVCGINGDCGENCPARFSESCRKDKTK